MQLYAAATETCLYKDNTPIPDRTVLTLDKFRKKPRKSRRVKQGPPAVQRTLHITSLGRHGEGVAQDGDERIFVPFALAGEDVVADVSGSRAKLLEVASPSADRIEPFCPYFGQCGGCTTQHLHAEAYGAWKHDIVVTALRHKQIAQPVDPLVDAHGEGRRRVSLHVRREKGRTLAGFMQGRSHQMLDIDTCPILAPALAEATNVARELCVAFFGHMTELDVQLTATDGGLDCNIIPTSTVTLGYEEQMTLADCADRWDLARLSIDGDVLMERHKPVLEMGELRVSASPGGFLQATAAGEEALARLVLEHLGSASNVADLFCGVGPFALRVATKSRVYAADNSKPAIAALSNAARHTSGLKPLDVDVRDLFADPVAACDLDEFDAVIFNPPRAGAQAQVDEIAASELKRVIAVSCDPASFSRDAETLLMAGFKLSRVTPVDQFKWSSHVEVVALFIR